MKKLSSLLILVYICNFSIIGQVPKTVSTVRASKPQNGSNLMSDNQVAFKRGRIDKLGKLQLKENGYMYYQKKKENITKVTYISKSTGLTNPYEIEFDYTIEKQTNSYKMDMIAIIDPFDTRIHESIVRTYQGDDLIYPFDMKIGQKLNDASGIFTLTSSQGGFVIKHKATVTKRVLTKIETISYDNQSLKAYVIQSTFKYENVDPNAQESKSEIVTEWFVPEYGIVKQERNDPKIVGDETISSFETFKNK
jgi:hypothetical protein